MGGYEKEGEQMKLRDFIRLFCNELDDVKIEKYIPNARFNNQAIFEGLGLDVARNSIFDKYMVLKVEAIKNFLVLTVTEV